MQRAKIFGKSKPWLVSFVIHGLFLGSVILLSGHGAVSNGPVIYSSNINLQAPSQETLITETHFPSFFNDNLFEEVKNIIVTEEPIDISSDMPTDFITDLTEKNNIPDAIAVYVPSDSAYKRLGPKKELKPTPRQETATTLFVPAKPLNDSAVNKAPVYPKKARELGQEGLVLLSVEISREGTVSKVEIIKSSGYTVLDESAIATIKTWKFTPAMINGEAVECSIKIPIRFKLT
ncbi:MAG: energy transducer TonB [Planctomycetes bacterium]|nr:energy transducer TonB [Planctomycetota bacterium]